MQQPEDHTTWHEFDVDDVFARLESTREGLTSAQANERIEEFGRNTLEEEVSPGLISLVLKQLVNPLVLMLLAAAAVSLLAGHVIDALVIAAVVLLNSVIGVIQERRAEEALEALRQLSAPHARVLRDGSVVEIAASEIVPGEVVVLETGDRPPADMRIFESVELTVDESALTGESEPVDKATGDLPADTGLADRTNMAWTSTAVTGGRARGVVVSTGMSTVIGKIASDVQSTGREDTPLQRRLAKLSLYIGIASITAAVAIFVFGIMRGIELVEMLLFAVAAAVSAIPEGLPAVVSVVLALGVQRMSHRKAILRRLPAVETLGSTTVVCTDKTGTITKNQMTVRTIWTWDEEFHAEDTAAGASGSEEGDVEPSALRSSSGQRLRDAESQPLTSLLTIGVVSNNARIAEKDGGWSVEGNPTEAALLMAAADAGIDVRPDSGVRKRIDEIPFSSSSKYAAALAETDGVPRLFVKGAPERILAACSSVLTAEGPRPLDDNARARIESANHGMAEDALRVVAGAFRDLPEGTEKADRASAEDGLTFAGMWGMLDPPRDEAVHAIAAAQGAGVRVVMITGDHATTADAIAREVGIIAHGEQTVDGRELDSMSDDELQSRVGRIAVYARVEPEHKFRIVEALKRDGEVVAMTGDGVNDAPALKAADIGIAMGQTGTEVAKEAADMVLADDNFATIIDAIEEGRVIYSNLRRVVAFLISTTTAEVITLFTALALGFHLPLTAVMILWINLVADGISTIPLGLEPKHDDVLKMRPRPKNEGVLTPWIVARLLVLALVAATVTVVLFVRAQPGDDLAAAQTVAFTTLAAFEWFKAITWRTSVQSVFSVGLFANRWLVVALAVGITLQVMAVQTRLGNIAFGTVPLSSDQWLVILAAASSVLVIDEVGKVVVGRRYGR